MPHPSRFVALILFVLCSHLTAQLDPSDTLASTQPDKKIEVTLFVAEPDVVNPTCIDIDPQGRVWVYEGSTTARSPTRLSPRPATGS